ncbi:MAG: hypothetical protein MUO77_00250, partial [Anaerolineales bacterium]|nr:hypothetical protein [Anaerolineales bacterium]
TSVKLALLAEFSHSSAAPEVMGVPEFFTPASALIQRVKFVLTPPGPIKAPHLISIIAGLVDSNNYHRLNETWRSADLLIDIPVQAYGIMEFEKYAEIVDLGYRVAQEQLKGFTPA